MDSARRGKPPGRGPGVGKQEAVPVGADRRVLGPSPSWSNWGRWTARIQALTAGTTVPGPAFHQSGSRRERACFRLGVCSRFHSLLGTTIASRPFRSTGGYSQPTATPQSSGEHFFCALSSYRMSTPEIRGSGDRRVRRPCGRLANHRLFRRNGFVRRTGRRSVAERLLARARRVLVHPGAGMPCFQRGLPAGNAPPASAGCGRLRCNDSTGR